MDFINNNVLILAHCDKCTILIYGVNIRRNWVQGTGEFFVLSLQHFCISTTILK